MHRKALIYIKQEKNRVGVGDREGTGGKGVGDGSDQNIISMYEIQTI